MLTIDGVTVRLGGRAILERASATVPVGARVGLIGRNGAGKSTLMKALIGEIEPDDGEISKPARAKIGYIAQEAPSGSMTPEQVVLAAATERAELLAELETCTDMDRMGDVHERLLAIDAYSAPARAAKILNGLGFDEAMQQRPAFAAARLQLFGEVLQERQRGQSAAYVVLTQVCGAAVCPRLRMTPKRKSNCFVVCWSCYGRRVRAY